MKRQQVNLYQPIFRKTVVPYSFATLLWVIVLSVLFMGAIQAYGVWQHSSLKSELQAQQRRHETLQTQVADMEKRLPRPEANRMLEVELQGLVEKRKQGVALLNVLRTRMDGNDQGFSGYFEGLARQTAPGLWFTLIQIGDGGTHLAMEGNTLTPERVPGLLQKLEAEEAFAGKSFQVMQLRRQDEVSDSLSFNLSTRGQSQ